MAQDQKIFVGGPVVGSGHLVVACDFRADQAADSLVDLRIVEVTVVGSVAVETGLAQDSCSDGKAGTDCALA